MPSAGVLAGRDRIAGISQRVIFCCRRNFARVVGILSILVCILAVLTAVMFVGS